MARQYQQGSAKKLPFPLAQWFSTEGNVSAIPRNIAEYPVMSRRAPTTKSYTAQHVSSFQVEKSLIPQLLAQGESETAKRASEEVEDKKRPHTPLLMPPAESQGSPMKGERSSFELNERCKF